MTELPHNCEGCVQKTLQVPSSGPPSAVATGAEPKQPTPLREAWAADGAAGVWGLFKSRNTPNNQSAGSWKDGRNANGVMVENQMLKQRITELEKAVDSALEAVAGRGV